MENYDFILKSAIEKLQSGKSVEEIIEDIIKSANEELKYEVTLLL